MSKQIGPHARGVLQERVDDEILLYNPATDTYFNLNPTATAVWDLANGDMTVEEIAAEIATEYGQLLDAVVDDVAKIAERFVAAGLLVDAEGAEPQAVTPPPR
ncbi:MAG TPA: PqqD family protein [Acidimicrobiia bacterium]